MRASALRRLGYSVEHISPYSDLPPHWALWLRHTGGFGLDTIVAGSLAKSIRGRTFDIAFVDSGDVVGPGALRCIKRAAPLVANYNADNPYCTPQAEKHRWSLFRSACPGYDLLVTPNRERSLEEMEAVAGRAPKLMTIWQCADEVLHAPPSAIDARFSADVAFVGTWMPGRDTFLLALQEAGLSVAVYGPRWNKAPEYSRLKGAIRSAYLGGEEYRQAVAGAKIGLVMLNPANHDLHTTRSAEIPAIGTAMCAPRTSHHLTLFSEGEEAIFFDDAAECAEQCRRLLLDDSRRRRIAIQGRERTFANNTYNEHLMSSALSATGIEYRLDQ